MNKKPNRPHVAKAMCALLLFLITAGSLKAQPTVHFGTADADGNGVADNFYYGTNAYIYILHGGTNVWTYYYVGPTFNFYTGGTDLDGYAGVEIAVWHPSSQSIIVITDRTKTKKSYYLGATGINSWVSCTNTLTNLNGVAGAEIMINYYSRPASSKRGHMIIHRTQTTKSTWTCFNLTREAGGRDDSQEVPNETPEISGGTFDETTATPEEIHRFKTSAFPGTVSSLGKFSCIPNPATGMVTLQTEKPGEVITQVVISDISGRTLFTSKENNRQVDISSLNSGLYICRVQTNEKTYVGKLMKQ